MSEPNAPFSIRHGFEAAPAEITIRYEAPDDLRHAILALANRGQLSWKQIVRVLTNVILVSPENNWRTDYLERETRTIMSNASWSQVYDIAEVIYLALQASAHSEHYDKPPELWYENELNRFFRREGIGWQMVNGAIEFRGDDQLESTAAHAIASLESSGRRTAAKELEEARRDLSRRPDPDTTGTVQHAMVALECLARDLTGDPRPTLGDVLKRNPGLMPKPLDEAMHRLWGYTSEVGRHLREGRTPSLPEALLVFGVVSATTSYLVEREQITQRP